MIDLLINLLSPLFIAMGASVADVGNYLRAVSGYIYAILILVALLIVVMVAAHFVAKKGTRHVVRWSGALSFSLALVLIVNLICYGPMNAIVSGVLNASKAEISDDVAGNSRAVVQEAAEEGMVLVKNNGLLPLSGNVESLNVFGWASANPVYSGTGSAASGDNSSGVVSIIQSLQDAGYATNDELTNMYLKYWEGRPEIGMNAQNWSLPEPTSEYYEGGVMSNAAAFSDTAVIVIARSGGENADLPTDMYAVQNGTYDVAKSGRVQESVTANYGYTNGTFYGNSYDYNEFDEGGHFLELSHTEKDLVENVCAHFDNVIVVINANNAMELSWVDDYDEIGAVILTPGTG